MAKKKVKICKNLQCENRVNEANAPVCVGCGLSFRGVSWRFLSEEEIQKALLPEVIEENEEEQEEQEEDKRQEENAEREVIICPNCGVHVLYHVGIQECNECGEYIQEEIPVKESEISSENIQECSVKGMRTVDGIFFLEFDKEYMEIGRLASGQAYFESNGKRKVSRQHAKVHKREDGWYISYCKLEDRNYYGGVQNPIYINNREMGSDESYRLQIGDLIAFSELNMQDPMAAFFRVE